MTNTRLSVGEINEKDIESISDYWLKADPKFLTGMGVDLKKMPNRDEWQGFLSEQLTHSYPEKKSYCIIWQLDRKSIGHSNVNKIIFGNEAYMHLHLWDSENRKKGFGTALVKLTIPYFFNNLKLKKICCETYQLNLEPNKTLENNGFILIKQIITVPGWLNFEQPVNLWELSLADYRNI